MKALLFYKSQQYNEAIKSWEKVLALDPGHEKAILNITKVNHFLNYDAIVGARQQKAAGRQEAEKYYLIGLQYYNGNDYKNAIKMWEQVLEIDPDNTKARNNIRTCNIILSRY